MADMFCHLLNIASRLEALPLGTDRASGKIHVYPKVQKRVIHQHLWTLSYTNIVLPTDLFDLHKSHQTNQFTFTLFLWSCGSLPYVLIGVFATRPNGLCQTLNSFSSSLLNFPRNT